MEIENGQDFVGIPDDSNRLWTPHRMAYIGGENKPKTKDSSACPFCTIPEKSDEEALIVYRGQYCYVVMNLYPYNSGHILVVPYRHIPDYTDLTFEERIEFGEITAKAMRVIRVANKPDGFNLGMNQGAIAGAGIAAHLHQHIVPRWGGDANFFPIIAKTKALPQLLGDVRQLFANTWEQVD
ncbi:HIT domain-containing protein [Actinomyces sp. zg-332]|uniref:HIT family protein n=1 Tax=Actinomyces sp. zg-332 TaxID=2708340 RepID=UPI00141F87BF|nr:HIT domain-containing protein [Actinomyces sp. zg-332]QPK94512.1 HIT domain-containing protein [Actinomyces sp. zg-332]